MFKTKITIKKDLFTSHLFVGKDEQQSISKFFLCQQFGQLTVRLHQPVSVTAVNHKHHRWDTKQMTSFSHTHSLMCKVM